MEPPMSNSSMQHREPKSEIDDTGHFLQGASCIIAADAAASLTANHDLDQSNHQESGQKGEIRPIWKVNFRSKSTHCIR